MGRIVAIGGGAIKDLGPMHKYAIELVGEERPRVLFIPTASKDNEGYIKAFNNAFAEYECEVKQILLTKEEYSESELDELFAWANLVYVGGGNALYMMNMWRRTSLIERLKEVFYSDSAVLVGEGCGCLCWFNCGYSNSTYAGGTTDWQLIWVEDLLDLHHVAVCPHYNEDERLNFEDRLIERGVPAIGLQDGTAFVQVEQHTEFIACTESDRAYYLVYLNGKLIEKEIKMRCLSKES